MDELRRKKTRRDSDDQIGWAVVGDRGAIEFWFLPGEGRQFGGLGGVEKHSRTPFSYSDSWPDHEYCELLEGSCWHDGSSLWASERWIPMYEKLGEEWVWNELEIAYRNEFERAPRDPGVER